ncbi:MAG TPA: DUF2306 domain-containing protein [Candidatus Dormibacteraeota bacterium]|nr:DUF2306 domain-containing protein [Candidatus Dormibacteraeota bacterium]
MLVPILAGASHSAATTTNPRLAQLRATDEVFAAHPRLTLIHIIPGVLFMLLGPFQFSRAIRRKYPKWHRINGRIFVICAYIVGISALVMSVAMPSISGVNQAVATTLFGILFLIALTKAFRHILRGEILQHREWMIRAYAVGLAVATIRPIVGFFFATSSLTGLTPREFFGTAFWLGFTVQTIAAEIYLHATRSLKFQPT